MERYFKNRRIRISAAIAVSILLSLAPAFFTLRSYQAQLPENVFLSPKAEAARFLGYTIVVLVGIVMGYRFHRQKKEGYIRFIYIGSWIIGWFYFGNEFQSRVPSQSILAVVTAVSEMVPGYIMYADFQLYIKLCIAASCVGYTYAAVMILSGSVSLYRYLLKVARPSFVNNPN